MKKIVVILGPTSTGKTNLAVKLCKKFNGEIISVDSRQAYKGMEIGTGRKSQITNFKFQTNHKLQITKENIPTHLYDIVDPDQRLNAFDYSLKAWEKMEEIWAREKTPFLVGGTGFYLDVILGKRKLSGIGVNQKLRDELEKMSIQDLIEKLSQLDPDKLKTIDVKNKYRLIRAIEIDLQPLHSESLVEAISSRSLCHPRPDRGSILDSRLRGNDSYSGVCGEESHYLMIGLTSENPFLYERSDQRVEMMIQSGLVEEVKGLAEKYGWAAPGLNSLGYRELKSYLDGSIQLNIAVEKIKFNTHAYIRRQKTYFKKYYGDARWFDVSQKGFEERVQSEVESFLR